MTVLRRLRIHRLRRLEAALGPYTQWGSGPYGTSSEELRARQIELARLRQNLGLPQETNWVVAPVMQLHGVVAR